MTEIPEHLLKRSQARRAAASGGTAGDGAASDNKPATTAAASTPAPAATGPVQRSAAPATADAPAPKPDSGVVKAFKSRKRIPPWAMFGMALLPVWGFMYVSAITPEEVVAEGPLGLGAEQYSSCSSCHGADGGGTGAGRQFSDGEVLKTFPHIEDQLRFVYYGTEQYNAAGIDSYGNPDRDGGAYVTGSFGLMPAQGGVLTDYEILAAVCHERYTLGGADPESEEFADEYELWCSEESEAFTLLEEGAATLATLHEALGGEVEIIPIGDAPVAGSPPS